MDIFKFEENERSRAIPLELLEKSVSLEDAQGGFPKTRPIESWDFFRKITSIIADSGKEAKLSPIFVDARSSHRYLTKEEKQEFNKDNTPINKWGFDRCIARFSFPIEGEDYFPSIGMSFNENGLEVCWGLNVLICKNMSIFGFSNMLRTYVRGGEERSSLEEIQLKLIEWMKNFDQKFSIDREIVHGFMESKVEFGTETLIGQLYKEAIEQSYYRGQAPFDTYGVSTITRKIIDNKIEIRGMNGWDLYNFGTELMKPKVMGTKDIWPNTIIWTNFVLSMLGLTSLKERIENLQL